MRILTALVGGVLAAGTAGQSPPGSVQINHVLATGQSLATGVGSTPLTTAQPYENLMFDTGVRGTTASHFVPLISTTRETPHPAFANLAALMASATKGARTRTHEQYPMLVTCHAVGGLNYNGLKKGTPAYQNGIDQLHTARRMTTSLGWDHVVRAVTVVHGESDHSFGNPAYATDLIDWQTDYERDVQAVTGQVEPVPILQSQLSSWTWYGSTESLIPMAQLTASRRMPRRILLVGPKYHLPYADGVHLTGEGYRWLGEYYALTYHQAVVLGNPWAPLMPVSAARNGTVIRVRFHVPSPPLVLDTTRVSDPGHFGFEYQETVPGSPLQAPARARITRVRVVSEEEIEITLDRLPQGSDRLVRYAMSGRPSAPAGPTTGPRGNLRDSQRAFSHHGHDLYNWCVHFEIPVP